MFHVQPNKFCSPLTCEQKTALEKFGQQNSSAIAIKSKRSLFGNYNIEEIRQVGVNHERTIPLDTNQWWRVLYDPNRNEIWVDIKERKVLHKYRGFQTAED
jgi:hypothetical protein